MQTSVRRFLWAGVAALVALVAVPVASAFGAGSVTTTFPARPTGAADTRYG